VIEFNPTASVDVLYVAFPLLMVLVPSVVLPFLKVTVPVAADGVTVAVNVTDELNVDGFADEARVTVEFALLTVCVSAEDVLELYVELPPYPAVIEFEPTASVAVLYVALPPLSVPVPSVVLPVLECNGARGSRR
jgi:hypothetical protein